MDPPKYETRMSLTYDAESSEGIRKLTDIYMSACKSACSTFEFQRASALEKYKKEIEAIDKAEKDSISKLDNAMISSLTYKLEIRPWYQFWR
jgi:hypothetical protein